MATKARTTASVSGVIINAVDPDKFSQISGQLGEAAESEVNAAEAGLVDGHEEDVFDADAASDPASNTAHTASSTSAMTQPPAPLADLGCTAPAMQISQFTVWGHPNYVDLRFCMGAVHPFAGFQVEGSLLALQPGVEVFLKQYELSLRYMFILTNDKTTEVALFIPHSLRPPAKAKWMVNVAGERIDLGQLCRVVRPSLIDWERTLRQQELMHPGSGDGPAKLRAEWPSNQAAAITALKEWCDGFSDVRGASIRRSLADLALVPTNEKYRLPEDPVRRRRWNAATTNPGDANPSNQASNSHPQAKGHRAAESGQSTSKKRKAADAASRPASAAKKATSRIVPTHNPGSGTLSKTPDRPLSSRVTTSRSSTRPAASSETNTAVDQLYSRIQALEAAGTPTDRRSPHRGPDSDYKHLIEEVVSRILQATPRPVQTLHESDMTRIVREVAQQYTTQILVAIDDARKSVIAALEAATARSISDSQMEKIVNLAKLLNSGRERLEPVVPQYGGEFPRIDYFAMSPCVHLSHRWCCPPTRHAGYPIAHPSAGAVLVGQRAMSAGSESVMRHPWPVSYADTLLLTTTGAPRPVSEAALNPVQATQERSHSLNAPSTSGGGQPKTTLDLSKFPPDHPIWAALGAGQL